MSTESVLVSWKPPAEPNGDINQYTVYIKPSSDDKNVCIPTFKTYVFCLCTILKMNNIKII